MTLTQEQIDARKGKMTASRVAPLMTGDREAIMRLYREMIGEEEPENLDHVWPVRLGSATEQLNLDWYEQKNGWVVNSRGVVVQSPQHSWAAATLDGWDAAMHCPVECKHVGGREPLEVVIDRYQPQMQWQMMVTGAKQCALSVIMGANEPVVEYIPRDDDYIKEMVKRAEAFMLCVERRQPPVELPAVPPPADATKVVDMTGNNRWGSSAAMWLGTKDAADENKKHEKILKGEVEDDTKKAYGHGVRITRDRAGRLSLRRDD